MNLKPFSKQKVFLKVIIKETGKTNQEPK